MEKKLTPRETEVRRLVAEGEVSQKVADRLGLSVRTVAVFRAKIRRKLKIQDRNGFYRWAQAFGLVA